MTVRTCVSCGLWASVHFIVGYWALGCQAVSCVQTTDGRLSAVNSSWALAGLLVGHSGAHNWRLGSAQGVKIS